MQINEVIQKVDLTKRAIKYYEEQGLISVNKDKNGYRNYSEEDVKTLKEISVYRKLGISIKDIKVLLNTKDKQLLENIYKEKLSKIKENQKEIDSLRKFIDNDNVNIKIPFIPNMIILSLKYKEYHDALISINNRICNDLGLYYDSNYNLIMK